MGGSLRRRHFLGTSAAAATAAALGPHRAWASDAAQAYDVAIVGAGIAGMAAAQILKAAGKKVIVLEAADRIGGRCVSDNATFPGVVFDRGAQWFHQVLSYNPLFELARKQGYHPVEDDAPRQVWSGTRYDPVATKLAEKASADVEAALERAGEGVLLGRRDVTAADAIARAGISNVRYVALAEAMVGPLTAGANFSQISAQDLVDFVERPGGDDYLLRSGMGNFIATFGKGLNVSLNAPVRTISYGTRNGVVLQTAQGTVTAGCVIVTVSMGVLAAEAMTFDPPLPPEYRNAIDALPMGTFEKVALGFDRDVFGPIFPNTNIFQARDSENVPAVIAKLWNANVAVCYFGGRAGAKVDDGDVAGMKEYALDAIRQSFSRATSYTAASVTPWKRNPWTRGSYTYAKPGGPQARRLLVNPLGGEQLYFAGEALSIRSYGTLSAAYQSGVATAKAMLRIPSIVSAVPDLPPADRIT